MNAMERMVNRLQGHRIDRIPNFNIFMTFAARYIGRPLSRYYLDHQILCEANFAVQRDFQLDLVQAISDPYREAADLGAAVRFPHDGMPICIDPLIINTKALRGLRAVKPEDGRRMSDRLHAIALFRERVGGEIPIMGWTEGALALAATLRGINQLMLDLHDQPDWLFELLDFCCETEIAFAQAQLDAGADLIGLGDAVASQITPSFYQRFALPYEKRIFAAIKERGGYCRLHICGDTTRILGDMATSGADIIDIDWMVDMAKAAALFGKTAAVCGNQDPAAVMRFGSPQNVRTSVRRCILQGGPRCFSAAGCEIPENTPQANLLVQARVLSEKSH